MPRRARARLPAAFSVHFFIAFTFAKSVVRFFEVAWRGESASGALSKGLPCCPATPGAWLRPPMPGPPPAMRFFVILTCAGLIIDAVVCLPYGDSAPERGCVSQSAWAATDHLSHVNLPELPSPCLSLAPCPRAGWVQLRHLGRGCALLAAITRARR